MKQRKSRWCYVGGAHNHDDKGTNPIKLIMLVIIGYLGQFMLIMLVMKDVMDTKLVFFLSFSSPMLVIVSLCVCWFSLAHPARDHGKNLDSKLIMPMTMSVTDAVGPLSSFPAHDSFEIGCTSPRYAHDQRHDGHHTSSHARDLSPRAVFVLFFSFSFFPLSLI